MSNLCIYTLFDKASKLPRCTGIKDGEKIRMVELYRPGERKPLGKLFKRTEIIRKTILKAGQDGRPVVLSDFKQHIQAFGLPCDNTRYSVYDLHLPDVKSAESNQKDHATIRRVLNKMATSNIKEYQHILANAAIVYQDLENRGLLVNFRPKKPIWSQKTFSGRSKTTGFNIQGYSEDLKVSTPTMSDQALMIHFDWICADIRVASILSQDIKLQEAFEISDPYEVMMHQLNAGSEEKITRDECKTYLLKSINSMDFSSIALSKIYPQLGDWIGRCRQTLGKDNGSLETILKRRFRIAQAKNQLAVLNGVMQGSVAHAMQLCIRRIWEKHPDLLIAEIHDSLVMSCYRKDIMRIVDDVSEIMLHPFRGVLSSNPAFPLKVSVGKQWKQWIPMRIYRESGVTNAQEIKRKETPSESEEEGRTPPEEGKEKAETAAE